MRSYEFFCVIWHVLSLYRQSRLFDYIAFLSEAVNHVGAYDAVVLCFEAVLLVEGVEVTPMSTTVSALALLELASAVDHLGEELLAGAYVEVEDDDFAMRHAAWEHADLVIAHGDL